MADTLNNDVLIERIKVAATAAADLLSKAFEDYAGLTNDASEDLAEAALMAALEAPALALNLTVTVAVSD